MKAYFIDGKTSKRRAAKLRLNPGFITINYDGDQGETIKTSWKVKDINQLDVRTSGKSLRYGGFPHQSLEFETIEDLNAVISFYPKAKFHKSGYNKFTTMGWKGILASLAAVVILAILFFKYGTPVLADLIAQSVPQEYEEAMGSQIQATYLEYMDVDSSKSEILQEFYDALGYQSSYQVSVVMVNSSVVNAFALPGGYIVVFSAIIDAMENENELAALLAHEVSHINEQHSLRTLSRELALYILLASLTGDAGGFSAVILENSNMISSLSYSRKFEKEADLEGLELMLASNINPEGMITLFQKFENKQDSLETKLRNKLTTDTSMAMEVSQDTSDISWDEEWIEDITDILSTHPSPKNRIKYLREKTKNFDPSHYIYQERLHVLFNELKEQEE